MPARLRLALVTLAGLALFAGVLAPGLAVEPVPSAASLAVIIGGAAALTAFGRFVDRNGIDPLAPAVAFPVAAFLWFGLAALPLLSNREGHRPPIPPAEWFAVVPGIAAYLVGAAGWPGLSRPISRAAPLPPFAARELDPVRLFRATILLTLAAAGVLAAIYARHGLPFVSGSFETMRLSAISTGYERVIAMSLVSVAILIFAHAATTSAPRGQRFAPRFAVLLSVSLALLALSGGRGFVVMPLFCGIALFHTMRRRFSFAALAGLAGLLAVFAAAFLVVRGMSHYGAAYYADYLRTITNLPAPLAPAAPIVLGVRAGPAAFGDLLGVVPAAVPFQNGRFLLAPLISWLPGHQEWAPAFIQRILHHDFPGFGEPATLFGSFYLDFGIPGVLVGSWLTGLGFRFFYRRFDAHRDIFHGILLAHYGFLVLFSIYGDMYNGLFFFLWNAGIAWLVIGYAGKTVRPEAAP